MDVTPLGTGSAVPTGDRYQTSLVVDSPKHPAPLLIDCGAGTIHRLVQAGHDPTDVGTVLLTHHHLDHVADIPSLLKARTLCDAAELTILGPPGTAEYLSPLLSVDRLADRAEYRICELDRSSFSVAGYEVRTCPTEHSTSGFAYRIDDAFTFSGDTEASQRIAAFADGSNVLVHDCAYLDESRPNHATPAALGNVLADIDLEKLYLTHLYPEAAAETEELRHRVSECLSVETRIANDLEPIRVQAE